MQARLDEYTNTAAGTLASLGTHWVMSVTEDGELSGVYARDVPVPANAKQAMADGPHRKQWVDSIEKELRNMADNEVWEVGSSSSAIAQA